jgi:CubicO group peptidase (beta-lactamase class C family)
MSWKSLAVLTTAIICCLVLLAGEPIGRKGTINLAFAPDAAKTDPVFASDSFWYAPIKPDAALHPDSKNLVAAFLRQKARGVDDIVAINTESFASPVYVADEHTPTVTVKVDRCFKMSDADFKGLTAQFNAVPIPKFAEPAGGDDQEMTIYQPTSDTMWEFWRAEKTDEWHACWGGRMEHVSKSSGVWPKPFGATATGLPFAGGQITREELDAHEIKHVIGISLVQASDSYTSPAVRSDGTGCCGDLCIPEGARFRLDPCVDVDKLGMHPVGKTIAKAAQRYGFVVWDKAGTTSLRVKNPKSYTRPAGGEDPYPKIFAPKDQWTVLDGFPWDKIQFLPFEILSKDPGSKLDEEWKAKSAKVDELLNRWVSPKGPGVAVMVIQNDKVKQCGYGLARLGSKSPMPIKRTTRFRLASMTKQFTGMAVAMLMEDEKLNLDGKKLTLDDRLHDFFPDQPAREIRIRHLLNHTAGLQEYGPLFRERGMIDDTAEFRTAQPPPTGFEPTNSNVLSLLKTQTLYNYPPGRVWNYNNSGYVCLAAVIEKKSGLSYGEFLKRKIFDKLEMADTFVGDNPDRRTRNLAYSYDFRSVADNKDIDYSPLNKVYGEDGVYSSLADLYKWDQALLYSRDRAPGAKSLVSDKTLDLIFSPGILNDESSAGYGFGWFVGNNAVWHDGDWLGFRTYIERYPKDRFTIVVLSNYGSIDVAAVAKAIAEIYYPPGKEARFPKGTRAGRAVKKNGTARNPDR